MLSHVVGRQGLFPRTMFLPGAMPRLQDLRFDIKLELECSIDELAGPSSPPVPTEHHCWDNSHHFDIQIAHQFSV